MYQCCLCGSDISIKSPKTYFCSTCYRTWKHEIINKVGWAVFLQNDEAKRRRREKRDLEKLVYLGDDDIAEIGGDYKIIYKYKEEI